MAAGEGTKGRQDGQARFAHEAGQTHRVARGAAEVADRVQVAGEHEVGGVRLRVVAAGEGAEQPGFVHHGNARLGRRVARAVVVVAAHQRHVQAAVLFAPVVQGFENRGRAAGGRVQEVAEEHQPFGAVQRDEIAQPREVVARGAARHGLAQRAEAGGLAQVQVGNEQGLTCWPRDGVAGQQVQRLAGPVDGGVGRHAIRRRAAPSRISPRTRRRPGPFPVMGQRPAQRRSVGAHA